MQIAFHTAEELKQAIDDLLSAFPVALYYNLDSIAPFIDAQCHGGVEMYYVFQGTGSYFAGDTLHPLQKGTLVIIKPYTIHKVIQHSSDCTIGRHVLIWQSHLLQPLPLHSAPLPWQQGNGDCLVIQADESEQRTIEALYRLIHEEIVKQEDGCLAMCTALIQQLLVIAVRIHQAGRKHNLERPVQHLPREIQFLVQYICSNFQEPLSLGKLAGLVYMNPAYLTTLFKHHTGYPLARYIQQRRIHHSQKLLTETKLHIKDIAVQCGFNQASQFIKIFRQLMNMTPAAYRRLHTHITDRYPPFEFLLK